MLAFPRPAACALAALSLPVAAAGQQPAVQVLDPALHHLGSRRVPTWTDVPADPEGPRLDLAFAGQPNDGELVLSLRHRDVEEKWTLLLNGVELGTLEPGKRLQLAHFVVPPQTLRAGDNELSIAAARPNDNIVVGDIRVHLGQLREVLALQPVAVEVRDGDGSRLPAKVTVTDRAGALTDIYYAARLPTAVRKGIAYTGDGDVHLELPPGEYTLWASRGPEWGLARTDIAVELAEPGAAPIGPVRLAIRREVATPGFIAADTHVHTYTHSGHGDASIEERLVTLAGEGVELAVATDHNHHTDYRPAQARMSLDRYFTSVTGNEVSTKVGHINAFPLDPREPPPDHTLRDWIALVDGIRAKGAQVVILNHPRWPQIPTGPFGIFKLDRLTGELPGRQPLPFDAIELVNATALQNDPLYLFVDWFALLNYGEQVTAVGSSDSHTVGDPVGQGRTYVRSNADDPAAIDVGEACHSFSVGDTTISLGIYAELAACEHYHPGQVVPLQARPQPQSAALALRVAAPSWVRPREVLVFVNGTRAVEQPVAATRGRPTDVRLPLSVPLPAHDAWVVCVVLGDGVTEAFWRTQKGYTLAATNPVYFDGDGDGTYSSPRALALALLERTGTDPERLGPALRAVDDAVAVEAVAAARAAYEASAGDATQLAAARAQLRRLVGDPPARAILARYLDSLPPAKDPGGGEPGR